MNTSGRLARMTPRHRPRRAGRRAGFTMADLAVGLAAVAFLVALALPAMRAARSSSNQSVCANNLRQIALAAIMYAGNEVRTGAFPRTYYDPTGVVIPTQYTGANSPASFPPAVPGTGTAPAGATTTPAAGPSTVLSPPGGPAANDVTAALYLLLKTQEITSDVFVCPDGDAQRWEFPPGDDVSKHSNFPSRQYLDYSFANPYPSPAAVAAGWKFNNSLGSDYPLAADMNPGGAVLLSTPYDVGAKQMRAINSRNHEGEGQLVVYCDAHVEFQQTPFCGAPRIASNGTAIPYRDNIYTCGIGTKAVPGGFAVKGPPQDPGDMVLLPTVGDGFQPAARPARLYGPPAPVGVVIAVAGVVLVGMAIVAVSVVRWAKTRLGHVGQPSPPAPGQPPPA